MAFVVDEGAGERAAPPTWDGVGNGPSSTTLLYIWDPDWGGAFWKANDYAPFPIWLWLNSHAWTKRQLDKAEIA